MRTGGEDDFTREKWNERATGIEPAWPAWKAGTLPLSYARVRQLPDKNW
jgi:hypothetical protein